MKTNLKKPCGECPFRRVSLGGWLGPWDSRGILWALGVQPFPCHKTIPGDCDTFLDPALENCAGAVLFLNNKLELSRDPVNAKHQQLLKSAPDEVKDSVFKDAGEFLSHHENPFS